MECLYNFAPGRLNEPVGASRSSLSAVTCWWSQWKGQHRDNWNIISTISGFPTRTRSPSCSRRFCLRWVFSGQCHSSFSHCCQVDFANEGHHPVREEAGSLFCLSWMLVVIWDCTTATMHHACRQRNKKPSQLILVARVENQQQWVMNNENPRWVWKSMLGLLAMNSCTPPCVDLDVAGFVICTKQVRLETLLTQSKPKDESWLFRQLPYSKLAASHLEEHRPRNVEPCQMIQGWLRQNDPRFPQG